MYNRRGELSIFRIGLVVGIVGLLAIGAGIASFFIDQSSRSSPLDVAIYPGAEAWGQNNVSRSSRNLFFKVPGVAPETVADFYQQRMIEHYGGNNRGESCVRIPPTGELRPNPNVPNSIPYQFSCMFDRSGFRATQYTLVTIYPGLPDPDPFKNAAGAAVIKYEQVWQP